MLVIDDYLPLVVLATGNDWSAAALERAGEAFQALQERGEPYSILTIPFPNSVLPTAEERRRLGAWVSERKLQAIAEKYCAAAGVVFTSPITRGALTAILWVWRPPFPLEFFRDAEEALDYCLQGAAARGVHIETPAGELLATIRARVADAAQKSD